MLDVKRLKFICKVIVNQGKKFSSNRLGFLLYDKLRSKYIFQRKIPQSSSEVFNIS